MKGAPPFLFALPLLVAPALSHAGIEYTVDSNDTITITGYSPADSDIASLVIPSNINGMIVSSIAADAFSGYEALSGLMIPGSVTNIGPGAFNNCRSLTSVTIPGSVTRLAEGVFDGCSSLTNVAIPDSVTNIASGAFYNCNGLTALTIPSSVAAMDGDAFGSCANLSRVYFTGNVPSVGSNVFSADHHLTIYYLPGAAGWSSSWPAEMPAVPTVLWNPLLQSCGLQNNQFDFNIVGTANIPVAVEACANLSKANWSRLQFFTLTNGRVYFSDPHWTDYPARYYRIAAP